MPREKVRGNTATNGAITLGEAQVMVVQPEAAPAVDRVRVPTEAVAELVKLGLQTELGDAYWRGWCLGKGHSEKLRLGINNADAVAEAVPVRPGGAG